MAAATPYPSTYNNSNSSSSSSSSGRGGGRPHDWQAGATPSISAHPTTAEALKAKARDSIKLSKWSKLDTILEEAAISNVHVNTGIGFGKLEQAYTEWFRCEEHIRLVPQSPEFNSMNEIKRRKLVCVQRDHEEQRRKIAEIEATLNSRMYQSDVNGGGAGAGAAAAAGGLGSRGHTSMQPLPRKPINGASSADPSAASSNPNRHTYNGAKLPPGAGLPMMSPGVTRPLSEQQQQQQWATDIPSQLKPRTQDDPLVARFSQLRTPTPQGQANGQPIIGQPKTGVPDSLRPARPTTPTLGGGGGAGLGRPGGPRAMPNRDFNKELPSTPPQLTTKALLDSLPRAPSPIYSPALATQAPGATPPRTSSMGIITNGRPPRPAREKPPFPELSNPNAIRSDQLFDLLKTYRLLLIDVRSREAFDSGHIHARSAICIEPIALKQGQQFDDLEGLMLYAPNEEVANLRRIVEFDLVVFYDQDTVDSGFLRGAPAKSPHMRYLFDALTDFNYNSSLQRQPAYLVGGIDAWVDLVSNDALQLSNTAPASSGAVVPQRRRTTRASLIGANSSREIRAQRLAAYNPLNADEERQWLEKARKEELAPADIRQFAKHSDGESVSSQTQDELFLPIQNMDDFFRRYPADPSQIRESMTSSGQQQAPASLSSSSSNNNNNNNMPRPPLPLPSSRPPLPPPHYAPPTAPPPPFMPIPSRPPPTASRPSYSGVSDHRLAQVDPQARVAKQRPPIYQSRSLAHTLKLPRTGLKNFGVTCYMNGTIQCLNATMPLSRFFLDETWRQFVRKNWKGSNGIMPEIFANLIRGLWQNDTAAVRPSSFRNFCKRLNADWGSEQQQDSKEFLEFLIDTLHEDFNENFNRNPLRPLNEAEEATREEMGKRAMNRVSKREWDRYTHRERSYVSSLFAGQHASQLRCTTCQKTSTTYEAFYSISVEIPQRGVGDVRACLESYCKEEQLSGNEEWRCPSCKCTRVATKRITITRLPQILVIHFKRFSAGRNESTRKVHTPIEFPLHGLDMQPYMADTCIEPGPEDFVDPAITPPFLYDCYAVMRHIGQTGNAGHYTALCRDAARGTWREFNDDWVSDFDPNKLRTADRLQNQQAYIVFYERAMPR